MAGGKTNLFFPSFGSSGNVLGQGTVGDGRASLFKLCKKTKTKTKSSLPYISGKAGPLSDSWETLIASEGEPWIWGWSHSGLW